MFASTDSASQLLRTSCALSVPYDLAICPRARCLHDDHHRPGHEQSVVHWTCRRLPDVVNDRAPDRPWIREVAEESGITIEVTAVCGVHSDPSPRAGRSRRQHPPATRPVLPRRPCRPRGRTAATGRDRDDAAVGAASIPPPPTPLRSPIWKTRLQPRPSLVGQHLPTNHELDPGQDEHQDPRDTLQRG